MEILVGKITHYFSHLGVAVVELCGEIHTGDRIAILGHSTDIAQEVCSMEIEHRKVQSAAAGMTVALMVADIVREGDSVFRVTDAEPLDEQRLAAESGL